MLYLHDDGAFYGFAYPNGPIVEVDQFHGPIRIVVNKDEHASIVAGIMSDDGFLDIPFDGDGEVEK